MLISIDIGGTNSRISSFKSFENPRVQNLISFEHTGYYNEDIAKITCAVRELTDERIEGIGLCIVGILNKEKSYITLSGNLPSWIGQPVKTDLTDIFDCPVVMANDGVATALGEAMYGHGRGKDFLFMIWGTGIGGTAVENINDQLHLSPFEPGHFPQNWNGPACPCGQNGCLEITCGGAGIERHYGKKAEDLNETEWSEVIDNFTHGLMNVIMIRPLPLIVLSGSIAVRQASRLNKINSILKNRLTVFDPPTIKISKFQEHAGLYGGVGLLKEKMFSNSK